MTLTETDKKLKLIGAHRNVSRALVFEWHKRYTDGFKETKHKKTLGQNLKKTSMPSLTRPTQLNLADRFFFTTLNGDL